MGSVGLSFGSPTSGQGFDVTSTVNQIVTNLQAVETPWKTQLTTLQSQDTALTSIGTDLSSLSTAFNTLNDFEGVFSEKEGSSSDTSVIALTGATSTAAAGTHSVVVSQLAQNYSYSSGNIGSGDTLTGSLSINNQTITLSDGTATDSNGGLIPQNDTLSALVSYINEGNYGVQASVVTNASGETQLALVSTTSGAGGGVSIDASQMSDSASGAVTFTPVQQGKDAAFTVDGVSTTSSSNTVSTAIPGVTMQLLDTSSAPVQVEITNNNSDIQTAVNSFVTAYNKVIGDLNTQEGSDSSGNPEPLYGSATLALLQEQLQQAVNFTQPSGAITSLAQLGITASASDDGTLTLDTSTLDNAINSSFQDVMSFFQAGSTTTTFGQNLTSVLSNLSNNAPDGAIYLALQQDSSQETALNQNITNQENLISAQKTQLTTELNEANYTLQAIPSQIDEVNELYSAITGYNQNSNG